MVRVVCECARFRMVGVRIGFGVECVRCGPFQIRGVQAGMAVTLVVVAVITVVRSSSSPSVSVLRVCRD